MAADPPAPAPERLCFTDFARRHGLGLTRFGYLLCGERTAAEDLVQEVMLAMYRRFGAELDIPAPVAYARRAMVNASISRHRHTARRVRQVALQDVPEPAAPAEPIGAEDALWAVVRTLAHRPRTVLVLRYYLRYADEEIAEVLGCRRSSVRSIAMRALAQLREHPDLVGTYRGGPADA